MNNPHLDALYAIRAVADTTEGDAIQLAIFLHDIYMIANQAIETDPNDLP